MRDKLENILKSVFSLGTMIAIAGGFITFVLFVIALIIGGETGGALAVKARSVYMPYFIRAASIGILSGLLLFYVKKEHELSLENEKKFDKKSEQNA